MMNLALPNIQDWVRFPRFFSRFVAMNGIFLVLYLLNLLMDIVTPGNRWGILYGTIATVLMVGVALLGVRKRAMKMAAKRNMGKVHGWLQFHLYGGVTALLFVFMHTGFSFPSGFLNRCLWVSAVWVTVSGLLGIFIQKIIPKMLSSGLSMEVSYERIPDLVNQIRERAEKIIPCCMDPVKDLYKRNMAAALLLPRFRMIYFVDITGGLQTRLRPFDYLRRILPVDEQERLDQLQALHKVKSQIDAHYTLQKVLRGWLYTHLPASLVLFLLIVLHLYVVWRY